MNERYTDGRIGISCTEEYSSLAQSVERMTVNHDVVGSSPTGGATSFGSVEMTDPKEPDSIMNRVVHAYQLLVFGGTAHGMKERRQSEPFYPAGIPNLTLALLPSV